jgi:hypothetical protein
MERTRFRVSDGNTVSGAACRQVVGLYSGAALFHLVVAILKSVIVLHVERQPKCQLWAMLPEPTTATPMLDLTCPECSCPIEFPVLANHWFVCCEGCALRIELSCLAAKQETVAADLPMVPTLQEVEFPIDPEDTPSWVHRAIVGEQRIERLQFNPQLAVSLLAIVAGLMMSTWAIFRLLNLGSAVVS